MSPIYMLLNLTVLALVFSLAACGGALPETFTSTPQILVHELDGDRAFPHR